MPTRDPTGEPIERETAAEAKARIREVLCPGPETCEWDHEHTAPPATDPRNTETIDTKEYL